MGFRNLEVWWCAIMLFEQQFSGGSKHHRRNVTERHDNNIL